MDWDLGRFRSVLATITLTDVLIYVLVLLLTRLIYGTLVQPFLSPLRKVPGKPYRPLVGNMLEARRAEAMSTAIRWVRELKSLTIRYYHFGGEERLLSADPKVFRHVLITHVDNYHRVRPSRADLTLMNQALFFLSGDIHHHVRKLLNPAFSMRVLNDNIPVFESKVRSVVKLWHEALSQAEGKDMVEVPAQNYLMCIALDSICAIGLDYQLEAVSHPQSHQVQLFQKYLSRLGPGGNILLGLLPFWTSLPIERNRQRWKDEAHISAIINETIRAKRQKFASGEIDPEVSPPKDLLSLLVLAHDDDGNAIPEDLIFENVAGLLFAGFDTTSITLTWLMLQLATYPAIQQRAREEILREIPDGGTHITHDLLDRLHYLTCVIKETQRLYPVVSSTTRMALRDDNINGLPIPAGTKIVLHLGALHRSEENWDDPETFNPDRFAGDHVPYTHIPFITGPYMCIGHKFATLEMKTVLAFLLREFEFSLVPGYKYRRVQALSVKPDPPLVLNIKKCVE